MAVENLNEKLAQVISKDISPWAENAKWRSENKAWLNRSQTIAMKILDRIEELGITQKELAERINVKPPHISQIVKGKENLTLETISKLESALGIELISMSVSRKYVVVKSYTTRFVKTTSVVLKLNKVFHQSENNLVFSDQEEPYKLQA